VRSLLFGHRAVYELSLASSKLLSSLHLGSIGPHQPPLDAQRTSNSLAEKSSTLADGW